MQWSSEDLEQFKSRNIDLVTLQAQLKLFERDSPSIVLESPCTLESGVQSLSESQLIHYEKLFAVTQAQGRCSKFVPASGAASRMFQDLLRFCHEPQGKLSEELSKFFSEISQLACWEDLAQALKNQGQDLTQLREAKRYEIIVRALLFKPGLNYLELPKVLIPFHRYPHKIRTALEEHLVESTHYIQDQEGISRLHFTVSQEHQDKVQAYLAEVLPYYQDSTCSFHVELTSQCASTDTLAVDLENQPFRELDGSLLFRPGGHGALLKNLLASNGDIVFIKNIDNVARDRENPKIARYKKALGGFLIEIQQQVFHALKRLESSDCSEIELKAIEGLVEDHLDWKVPLFFDTRQERLTWLYQKLHRPLRVCGMVKNQGQAGGGPFWVRQRDGLVRRQIVESAQVNLQDSEQKEIFSQSTHFNPVDLVCGLKDHQGVSYDLTQFVDPETAFISHKSKEGRALKALEWPGLWNGAMSGWNTLFVEVPLDTFYPVKVIFDLLKPAHQA